MKVLLYHKKMTDSPEIAVQRAQRRARIRRKTLWWDAALFVLVIVCAVWLLPYAPYLSQIRFLRAFLPVNGSIWEHGKLLFYPAVFVGVLRYLVTGDLQKGILTTYAAAIFRACGLHILLRCTFTGVIGTTDVWVPPAVLGCCGGYMTYQIARNCDRQKRSNIPGMLLLLLLEALLMIFTEYPQDLGIFAG